MRYEGWVNFHDGKPKHRHPCVDMGWLILVSRFTVAGKGLAVLHVASKSHYSQTGGIYSTVPAHYIVVEVVESRNDGSIMFDPLDAVAEWPVRLSKLPIGETKPARAK